MTAAAERLSADGVATLKSAVRLEDLVAERVSLKRSGRTLTGKCPFHADRNPSFAVYPERQRFVCYAASCGAKGDVIDWLREAEGLDYEQAIEVLRGRVGLSGDAAAHLEARRRKAEAERQRETARKDAGAARSAFEIWRRARPIAGTPVETYLREARGIRTLPLDKRPIRFLADCAYWDGGAEIHRGPAMACAFADLYRRFAAVHLTWLAPDGSGKLALPPDEDGQPRPSKKIRGRYQGRAIIRLAPLTETLCLAEGVETALSVMEACPGLCVWAAGSLANIGGAPLPDGLAGLVILGDNDMAPKGRARLREIAARRAAGPTPARLALPPAGMDFNDWLLRLEGSQ